MSVLAEQPELPFDPPVADSRLSAEPVDELELEEGP